MEKQIYKGGFFSAISEIKIFNKIITLSHKSFFSKKSQNFDLNDITKVELWFMKVNADYRKVNNIKKFNETIENFSITVAGITKGFSKKNKYEWVETTESVALIKPTPVAMFFTKNGPAFFIDYINAKEYLSAIKKISTIIGKNKFDEKLQKLIELDTPEIKQAIFLSKKLELIYILVFITLILEGLFFSFYLQDIIKPINSINNPQWIFLFTIIFSGIFAGIVPINFIYRIFVEKETDQKMQNYPELFRLENKFIEKNLTKISFIALAIYLISIVGISTSYGTITNTGINNQIFLISTGETKFEEINRIVISCGQENSFEEPFIVLYLDSINGPLIHNEKGKGLEQEQAIFVLSKLPQNVEIKLNKCYEGTETKIINFMDSLNYPINWN